MRESKGPGAPWPGALGAHTAFHGKLVFAVSSEAKGKTPPAIAPATFFPLG